MKIQLKYLLPSRIETAGSVFLAFVVILLANSKRLLEYYGLGSSNQLIKSNAGNVVTDGLKNIDSFKATDGVVTFLIWAVVGVVCFGIVEALGSGYQQIKLQKQISSNSYIQPAGFTKMKFWRSVVTGSLALLCGLGLLTVMTLLFALFLLPLSLAYSRVFLFDTTLSNALYLILGLFVVCFGLVLINICVRALLNRHRILKLN